MVLRETKRREDEIRAEIIATKYNSGDPLDLWKELNSVILDKHILPMQVDEVKGKEESANKWRIKFSEVLNSVEEYEDKEAFAHELRDAPRLSFDPISPEEVYLVSSQLNNGKSAGVDKVPAEFYKHAPVYIHSWLAKFFNSMISHGYLPPVMSDVLLIPIPKNKFGDVNSSSNYRPESIATAVSYIVEKLLMSRFCNLMETSDFQFGFKKYHSTDLCIFALKEVVSYYRTLKTPTFICFIDIKSAFDSVGYNKLFRGLLRRGVNSLLVSFLKNWYVNQRLFIRWGNATPFEFFMINGIRQGSRLSPYLINGYVNELNLLLSNAGV